MPELRVQPERLRALSIGEACERLGGIHRATFYRIPFFRTRRVRLSAGRVGVRESDVELYLQLGGFDGVQG